MSDPTDPLHGRIFQLRGHRVILDADLARLYGVLIKRLNEQVRRNRKRFPDDFAFQVTAEEFAVLRSQIATLNMKGTGEESLEGNWSQSATSTFPPQGHGKHRKYLPWAFTEHGALMAANVLSSAKAVEMAVYVVRAFIKQREALAANATILRRLAEIDRTLIEHDSALQILWKKLQPLLTPPPEPPKRRIGFNQ